MADTAPFPRSPLALIGSSHEWSARSLESILSPNGYSVLRAYTGEQVLDRLHDTDPDVVFLDAGLPDLAGVEVCRRAQEARRINRQTPVFITTSGHITRAERIEAFRAGAQDYLGLPFDAEELLLKLRNFVIAKQDTDRIRTGGLLDATTGLYNTKGLVRRVRELCAKAARHRRPIACIVVAPERAEGAGQAGRTGEAEAGGADESAPALANRIGERFRAACRASDTVGRVGDAEFVIVAPDTDPAGAMRLAQRLVEALETGGGAASSGRGAGAGTLEPLTLPLRAGYYAVPDVGEASIQPIDLLKRATMALRRSQADPTAGRIQVFAAAGDLAPEG